MHQAPNNNIDQAVERCQCSMLLFVLYSWILQIMIRSNRGVQGQANTFPISIPTLLVCPSSITRSATQKYGTLLRYVPGTWYAIVVVTSRLAALSRIQHVSHIIMASSSTLRRSSSSHYVGVSAHDDANDSNETTTSTTNGHPGGTAIVANTFIVTE